MKKIGHYIGVAFILLWGLAPFYWMLVTVPLIVMVLIFQRRIISGLTAGGVKG